MKTFVWAAAAVGALMGCSSPQNESQPLHEWVNPFVGTGGHGHTYPGATRPFGMVQLSPDSRLTGWDGCGGYHHSDDTLYGFSHTHLQGTGVSDYGDILFMPCTQFADAEAWRDRYKSHFSHDREAAHAGYYEVVLDDHEIRAELTTTERVGVHRYTRLNPRDSITLMIDMSHRDALLEYSIYPLDDSTLVGHRVSDNWAEEQHVYFAARFNHAFEWLDAVSEVRVTGQEADGTLLQEVEYVPVFAAAFGAVDTLVARVGLSFVDIQGALANLKAEAPHAQFDQYKSEAEAAWDEQLSRILVEGGSDAERETFYSALYHVCTTPNIASDVDGRYRGTDLAIHKLKPGETHYTIFSLWDTFRGLHPLLNWLEPGRSKDFIRTFLRMFVDGGKLPVWELAGNYTGCMIGYHAVPVIADAWTWGIRGFNPTLALEGMIHAARRPELGIPAFASRGYIPMEVEHESVSKTLEYAYDDACIANFARRIGQDSLADIFAHRGLHYRNLFNPKTGFIQPKRGGAWLENFDPTEVNFNYTEANGWQYNFFAPHDVAGHMELMGGEEVYLARLKEMFESSSETSGREQADITGLIGQYAHGNEPSHHMAYLFNHVGRPDLTQKYVHQILRTLYSPEPDGLSGNEDCGQMSAWYVWSAMGMYPVNPGSDIVELGQPMFNRILVKPAGASSSLKILKKGQGEFVQQASVDERRLGTFVTKSDLQSGSRLIFKMRDEKGNWGVAPEDRPVHKLESTTFVPVPIVESPRAFRGPSCTVHFQAPCEGCVVEGRFTDLYDIHRPLPDSITITRSISLALRTVTPDGRRSPEIVHEVNRVAHNFEVVSLTPFSAQYAAGGDQALVDGIVGASNFKTGDWQGTFGEDVEAVIDLGAVQAIRALSLGALRDIRPWIFFPESVKYSISMDGQNWEEIAVVGHEEDDKDESVVVLRFNWKGRAAARYVKAEAKSFGLLPDWHLGAGNPTWMFLDELQIEIAE
jgi:predicted alpha-1,2-mannosidase